MKEQQEEEGAMSINDEDRDEEGNKTMEDESIDGEINIISVSRSASMYCVQKSRAKAKLINTLLSSDNFSDQ
eukprot:13335639-Ditylum_brightwellii.AAC.1